MIFISPNFLFCRAGEKNGNCETNSFKHFAPLRLCVRQFSLKLSKRISFLAVLLIALAPAFAVDYGAILGASYVAEDIDASNNRTNRFIGILAPWLSANIGSADFYISAGMHLDYADYREGDKLLYIPDLFKLELSGKPVDTLSVRAGRIPWQDPSRLVAKGRYDGAELLWDKGSFRIGAAGLYTGLLYYDDADINVSPTDPKAPYYSADFDWSEFGDTYFAPRRALGALYGEFPGFLSERGNLYAGLMAQFDLSGADERFHTQYLVMRYTMAYKQFDMALAGVAELEHTDADGYRGAFATSVEGGWRFSGDVKNRLFLGMRWASGEGPNTAAFFPVIMEAQGLAIQNYLTGIMVAYAGYMTRLKPDLSLELTGRYFLKTDSSTFSHSDLDPDKKSYLVGAEIDAGLLWVPVSDLSFSIAGGAFLPKTGRAMSSGAPVRWSVTLGTIFSF